MRQFETTVSRIPVRTWNRLGLNDASLTLPENEGARGDENPAAFGEDVLAPFASPALNQYIDRNAGFRRVIRIPAGHVENEPILIRLRADAENPTLVDDILVDAADGAQAAVIVVYSSTGDARVTHVGRARVRAGKDAVVRLIKVQALGKGAAHTDAVGGIAAAGGRIEMILAELGAARTTTSCNLILDGAQSAADLDILYLGNGDRALDITCRAEHRGKKSESSISAKGVLMERSRKVLRDTLDFVSGSAGSRGREEENVLMLSPDASNVSVPLLLCGEDDVEGEHAASSGGPDARALFYLMSRGIGELEAKKLLAEAAVSSIVEKIPNEEIRASVRGILRDAIEGGGETR